MLTCTVFHNINGVPTAIANVLLLPTVRALTFGNRNNNNKKVFTPQFCYNFSTFNAQCLNPKFSCRCVCLLI